MSPRIGIAASLSSPTKKVGASTPPPTPTSTAGVLASSSIAGQSANTIICQLVVQGISTGGKALNASLQEGKTLSVGNLMNGTGTFTVTRAAQDGHPEATSTATCYFYYSSLVVEGSQTYGYFIAPTENSDGLSYGVESEFDLATDFAADISAQAPYSSVSATLQIGTFSFNVTVDSVLYNCTASNTVDADNPALVLPAS